MITKLKYGKISIVVFITILIWVWADLALDEVLPVPNATINVVYSNPKLWVSFDDGSSVDIEEMVLKGPLHKIAELSKIIEEEGLKIDFDAANEGMNEPGSYSLTLLPFLRNDKVIKKRLGLKVESCLPETLSVKVVGLVRRPMEVKCVDEDQNPIAEAAVDPAQVEILVPENWEKRAAQVMLTRREIEQARVSPIEKTPYIALAAGQTRKASKTVEITMPPEPDRLRGCTIQAPTLSIALSLNLQGKYKVEVKNLINEVLSPIAIKATPEAERAYKQQPFPQMTLYILDDDKKTTEEQKREVVYNFPDKYLRSGEIDLDQEPVIARFKLTPVSSAEASKGPPG
jgi:hypothetical protein